MFLLGLTGNIACGKSTVAQMLVARGAAHLDADLLVHELYAAPDFARRVAKLFPEYSNTILTPQNTVDRRALGELVFNDAQALQTLEALVHPAVAQLRIEKLQKLAQRQPKPRAVVVEAVKLIESGQAQACDVVWCVVCSPQVQLERLKSRGLNAEQACQRLDNQPDLEEKFQRMRSTSNQSTPLVLISNDGTLQDLENNVEKQWKALNFKTAR